MTTLHDTALVNGDGTSVTTISTADALAVTAGDLVFAQVKWEGSTGATANMDTGASTPAFTSINANLSHSNGQLHCQTFAWIATSTGTVNPRAVFDFAREWVSIRAFSITPTASKNFNLSLVNVNAAQGTSTTPSAGSASAGAAGAAFATFGLYGSVTLTPGTGWTQPAEFSASDADKAEYRLQTGAGSLTGDGTLSGGIEWVAQLAIFDEEGGGPPPAPLMGQRFYVNG